MNILINGGTKGIGKEIVLFMARDKSNKILVTGRDKRELGYLSGQFNNVHSFSLDLASYASHENSFTEYIMNLFTHVDIIINMAGMLIVKSYKDISDHEARQMMETNFFGPASVIRTVVPLLKKGSHIVNISSMGGFQGSAKYSGMSYYSASKAALACMSECLAVELQENGISVNCLALGAVQTKMFQEAFPGQKAPVTAKKMASFISDFALHAHNFLNGKIIPVAMDNPEESSHNTE
jgi:NAD(P)-dependent dehydrogenase (short-subunit alcohol dehydrogenase family)